MSVILVGLLGLCMYLVLFNHGVHSYISKINKSSVFLNQIMLAKQNFIQIMHTTSPI